MLKYEKEGWISCKYYPESAKLVLRTGQHVLLIFLCILNWRTGYTVNATSLQHCVNS